ncbi:large terminase protein [Xanthomonas phage XaC1]|nr:large terminase protein [Xanthomonas phage XaC1]
MNNKEIDEIYKAKKDVFYFAELCLGTELYKHQDVMLDNLLSGDSLNVAFRQAGTTTVHAIFFLWKALFNTNHTYAYLSNNSSSGTAFLEIVKKLHDRLPIYLQSTVVQKSTQYIKFSSNSIIFQRGFSANALRGFSFNALIVDNLCFVQHPEDFFKYIIPCTASTNAKIHLCTSLNHKFDLTNFILMMGLYRDYEISTFSYEESELFNENVKRNLISMYGEENYKLEYACILPEVSDAK